jgi:hypothetical protein
MRFAVVCLLLSCGSAAEEASRCEQLLDHLVSLRVAEVHPASGVDRESHRRALTQALGADFLTSCSSSLSESQIACALGASDTSAAAACREGAAR